MRREQSETVHRGVGRPPPIKPRVVLLTTRFLATAWSAQRFDLLPQPASPRWAQWDELHLYSEGVRLQPSLTPTCLREKVNMKQRQRALLGSESGFVPFSRLIPNLIFKGPDWVFFF